jgi:SAM-dependent methyltransferase
MRLKPKLLTTFIPDPSKNRMQNEGDLRGARDYLLEGSNPNLSSLLDSRYSWMATFIKTSQKGIEFGSGIGATKLFLPHHDVLLTDVVENTWLDYSEIDATSSGFADEVYDYIILNQVLHHLTRPDLFFKEARRILKPGGLLIIQDPYTSFLMKMALIVMRHEGFNDAINLRIPGVKFCHSDDPWSANCSTAKLIFESQLGRELFRGFEVIHTLRSEFLGFINSGGVTAKTKYIPLKPLPLKLQKSIDKVLCKLAPRMFALQIRVVLRRTN